MLRAALLLFSSAVITVFMYSCTRTYRYLIFENVQLGLFKDNGVAGSRLMADQDSCHIDSFSVHFNFGFKHIAYEPNIDLGLIGHANAYKPAPPVIISLEHLKDLQFYTINSFNSNYPAGSNITELVRLQLHSFTDTSTEFVSI